MLLANWGLTPHLIWGRAKHLEIEIQDSPIDSHPNASPLRHYLLGNLNKEKCPLKSIGVIG